MEGGPGSGYDQGLAHMQVEPEQHGAAHAGKRSAELDRHDLTEPGEEAGVPSKRARLEEPEGSTQAAGYDAIEPGMADFAQAAPIAATDVLDGSNNGNEELQADSAQIATADGATQLAAIHSMRHQLEQLQALQQQMSQPQQQQAGQPQAMQGLQQLLQQQLAQLQQQVLAQLQHQHQQPLAQVQTEAEHQHQEQELQLQPGNAEAVEERQQQQDSGLYEEQQRQELVELEQQQQQQQQEEQEEQEHEGVPDDSEQQQRMEDEPAQAQVDFSPDLPQQSLLLENSQLQPESLQLSDPAAGIEQDEQQQVDHGSQPSEHAAQASEQPLQEQLQQQDQGQQPWQELKQGGATGLQGMADDVPAPLPAAGGGMDVEREQARESSAVSHMDEDAAGPQAAVQPVWPSSCAAYPSEAELQPAEPPVSTPQALKVSETKLKAAGDVDMSPQAAGHADGQAQGDSSHASPQPHPDSQADKQEAQQEQPQEQQQEQHHHLQEVELEQHDAADGAVAADAGGDTDAGAVVADSGSAPGAGAGAPAAIKTGRSRSGSFSRQNFTVLLDMTSAAAARTRTVTAPRKSLEGHSPPGARRSGSGSGDGLAARVVGSGPAVTYPHRLYSNLREEPPGDLRKVRLSEPKSGKPAVYKVAVTLRNPLANYLYDFAHKAIPDPCAIHERHYMEGIKRMNEYLDAGAMREVMALHFELRVAPIIEFGGITLSAIRNKQAWLITNFRNAKSRTQHGSQDLAFSRTYTLGCYRIAALLQSRTITKMMDLLPMRKRKFLVFTLGQAEYCHMQDGPHAFFRLLLHHFTPADLVESMMHIEPLPVPIPKGNISVKQGPARGTPKSGAAGGLSAPRAQPTGSPDGRSRSHAEPPSSMGARGGAGGAGQGGRQKDGRVGRDRERARERGYAEAGRSFAEAGRSFAEAGWGRDQPPDRERDRDISDRRLRRSPEPLPLAFRDLPLPPPPDLGHLRGRGPPLPGPPPFGRGPDGRGFDRPLLPAGSREGGRHLQPVKSDPRDEKPRGGPGFDRGGLGGGYRYGDPSGARRAPGPPPVGSPKRAVPGPKPPPGEPPPTRGPAPPAQPHQQQQQQQLPGPPSSTAQDSVKAAAGLELVLQAALQQQLLGAAASSEAAPANPLADVISLLTGAGGAAANPQAALLQALVGAPAKQLALAGVSTDAAAAVAAALALQQQATLQQQVQQQMQQIQALQAQLQQATGVGAAAAAAPATAPPAAQLPAAAPQPALAHSNAGMPAAAPLAGATAATASRPGATATAASRPGPGVPAQPPPLGPTHPHPRGPGGSHAGMGLTQSRPGAAPPPAPVRLSIRAAAGSMPAPWRAALPPGSAQRLAHDAGCVGRYSLAVADGVAATRQLGIDSGPWAHALAEAAVAVADAAVLNALRVGGPVMAPRDVLTAAMERVPGSGAASCCIMYMAGGELLVGKVGPCGGIVLRGNRASGEMEAVTSWQPYGDPAERVRHLASPDLAPLVGATPPHTAQEERLFAEPGDILVLGTHGLFDMVWFHGPPSSNLLRELYALGHTQQVDPHVVANQLVNLAGSMGASGALSGSPLSLQLSKEGRAPIPMQDVGDNTAVLAYVVAP